MSKNKEVLLSVDSKEKQPDVEAGELESNVQIRQSQSLQGVQEAVERANSKRTYNAAIKEMVSSFQKEDEFINTFRKKFAWFILILVIILSVFIICLTISSFWIKFSIEIYITAFVTILVEVFGLLTILFKYLFNRKENKVLEIISKSINEFATNYHDDD